MSYFLKKKTLNIKYEQKVGGFIFFFLPIFKIFCNKKFLY